MSDQCEHMCPVCSPFEPAVPTSTTGVGRGSLVGAGPVEGDGVAPSSRADLPDPASGAGTVTPQTVPAPTTKAQR